MPRRLPVRSLALRSLLRVLIELAVLIDRTHNWTAGRTPQYPYSTY